MIFNQEAQTNLEAQEMRREAAQIRFETRMEEMRQQRIVGQFSVDTAARMHEMINTGYLDENGVQRKGLKSYSGQEMLDTGFSPSGEFGKQMRKWMETEANRRGLSDRDKEEFAIRMGDSFSRMQFNLQDWEMKIKFGASVENIDQRNAAEADIHRATEVLNARATAEKNANFALGAGTETPAPNYEADADAYLEYQGSARAKYALDLRRASLGCHSVPNAIRKANDFYSKQAGADIAAIVAEGDFGRARAYLKKGTDLGFSQDEIRNELLKVDLAEQKAQQRWVAEAFTLGANASTNGQLDDVKDAQGRVVPGVETAIKRLKALENALPIGSGARAEAAQRAAQLDEAADKTVKYAMFKDLATLASSNAPATFGSSYFDRDENGKIVLDGRRFAADSRAAKLGAGVIAAFEEKQRKQFNAAFREAHGRNLANARAMMMKFVAANNPQGYFNWLGDQVTNKQLTLKDFQMLDSEYRTGWLKGYKGQEGQPPKQMVLANKLLDKITRVFGTEFGEALARDTNGNLKTNNGLIYFDEKKDKPDLSYRTTVMDRIGNDFGMSGKANWKRVVKKNVDPDKILGILNKALNLALSDGAEIPFNPVTNRRLPNGQTHKVDALLDFDDFLQAFENEQKILDAAKTIENQTAYYKNVSSYTQTESARRSDRMMKSKALDDVPAEDKSE